MTNEDDCSAPADTRLYSLNGAGQNLANPLGPIANYRCNQFGHLCRDPGSADPTALGKPPLNPPSDAQGSSDSPTLNLADCESNDTSSGLLTPVSQFIAEIKALKADPSKITVGALIAPAAPYTVEWLPSTGQEGPSEIWPSIEHSCGPQSDISVNPLATDLTTDGSFGDPAVRITHPVEVQAFPATNGGHRIDLRRLRPDDGVDGRQGHRQPRAARFPTPGPTDLRGGYPPSRQKTGLQIRARAPQRRCRCKPSPSSWHPPPSGSQGGRTTPDTRSAGPARAMIYIGQRETSKRPERL